MKSMGRYTVNVKGLSILSAVILLLCFVISSFQVSYFIDIFDEIIEKFMSF